MGLDAKRGESRAAVAVRYMQCLRVRACMRVREWEGVRGTDHEEGWNKEDVRAEFAWNRSDVEVPSACKRAGPVPAGCLNAPRAEETESGADVAKSRASVPILDCRPVRQRSCAASQPRGAQALARLAVQVQAHANGEREGDYRHSPPDPQSRAARRSLRARALPSARAEARSTGSN